MKLRILSAVLVLAAASGCSSSAPATSDAGSSNPPSSPAFSPTGELVYATLPADRGSEELILPVLHTIDANGNAAKKLPLAAMGATWLPDGAHLLADGVPLGRLGGPGRPAVATSAGTQVTPYRLPGLPDEVNNCRSTSDLKYLVCDIAAGVVRVEVATSRTTMLSTGGENEVWDVSPQGRIVFARQASSTDGIEDAELYTINVDGTGRRRLTDFGEVEGTYDNAGGAWLPDGSAIITGTPQGKLVRVDARTGDVTEIKLDEDLFASRPSVSSDGRLIAFEAHLKGQDIYVTPVTGGPVALVVGTADDEIRPQWKPAGGMMH